MDSNKRLRTSVTAEAVSFANGVAGSASELVICVTCERLLKGKIGLSQHRRKAHASDYHAEHQVLPTAKARWAPEETRRMAALESSLLLSGQNLAKLIVFCLRNFQTDLARRLRV